MAKQGQNLRIFVDNRCIAAAKSSSCHFAATTENVTTKDTDSVMDEYDVTGFNWDASVEGLIETLSSVNNYEWDAYNFRHAFTYGGANYYDIVPVSGSTESSEITVEPGDILKVEIPANTNIYGLALFNHQNIKLYYMTPGAGFHGTFYFVVPDTNKINFAVQAYAPSGHGSIIVEHYSHNGAYGVEYLQDKMLKKQIVGVAFYETIGDLNREQDIQLFYGSAYITDFTINAVDRQFATFSAKLQGSGDFELPEDEDNSSNLLSSSPPSSSLPDPEPSPEPDSE